MIENAIGNPNVIDYSMAFYTVVLLYNTSL